MKGTPPAEDGDAAEKYRGDDGQFQSLCVVTARAPVAECEVDACKGRDEPRQGKEDELCPLNLYTGESGDFLVKPNGEYPASEGREMKQEDEGQG